MYDRRIPNGVPMAQLATQDPSGLNRSAAWYMTNTVYKVIVNDSEMFGRLESELSSDYYLSGSPLNPTKLGSQERVEACRDFVELEFLPDFASPEKTLMEEFLAFVDYDLLTSWIYNPEDD